MAYVISGSDEHDVTRTIQELEEQFWGLDVKGFRLEKRDRLWRILVEIDPKGQARIEAIRNYAQGYIAALRQLKEATMNSAACDALADAIDAHNNDPHYPTPFSERQLDTLADFCASQIANFEREPWLTRARGGKSEV